VGLGEVQPRADHFIPIARRGRTVLKAGNPGAPSGFCGLNALQRVATLQTLCCLTSFLQLSDVEVTRDEVVGGLGANIGIFG
jgi:hypothetical protein